jgi:hypothetical protein
MNDKSNVAESQAASLLVHEGGSYRVQDGKPVIHKPTQTPVQTPENKEVKK